jgi:hypothetical protein
VRHEKDRLQLVGHDIRARQDQQHAGHARSGRRVDRHDTGVHVGRTQHDTACLVRQDEVVDVTAAADQQPHIVRHD